MTAPKPTNVKIAGYLVYWTVGDADYDALFAEAKRAGFGACVPARRQWGSVYRSAMQSSFSGSGILIRPIKGRRHGVCAVRELAGVDKNDYPTIASVYPVKGSTDVDDVQIWSDGSTGAAVAGYSSTIASDLHRAIKRESGRLGRNKVSRYLALCVEQLFGQPLRDRGSIYWLPETRLGQWNKAIAACQVAAVSVETHCLQLIADPAAFASIASAIDHEIGKDATEMRGMLADPATLTGKAIGVIRDRSMALRDRITEYESILQTSMTHLTDTLADVETDAATALVLKAAGVGKGARS